MGRADSVDLTSVALGAYSTYIDNKALASLRSYLESSYLCNPDLPDIFFLPSQVP
jgi:hypothetical protein